MSSKQRAGQLRAAAAAERVSSNKLRLQLRHGQALSAARAAVVLDAWGK